ncbi:MAG: hypothetical protein ABL927_12940 [Bdellovibrionales bacterium]
MSHYFLCSQNNHSKNRRFFQWTVSDFVTAKQNQKFPFHFFFRFAVEGWGEETRSFAKRRDGGFRQNSPRVFEIQKKRAGREAGVYDEYIIQNFVLRANQEANNYQYLT